MDQILQLKSLLYDTLTLENGEAQAENISQHQQMGVSITKAISKEGVNIIQMPIQSVVSRDIIVNLVAALKLIDDMPNDGLAGHIKAIASQNLTLEDFQANMKTMYIAEMIRQSISLTDAAKKLGVQRTYLSKLKRELLT